MASYVNKRTAHRWKLLLVMLAGGFCALGSFWLLQVMRGQDDSARSPARSSEPDYIVDNFSFVRMSEAGQPRYVVSGARLTHRPIDDISEIDQPVVQSMTIQHPRMTMHANHARVLHGQDQVELAGNVDVQRPAAGSTRAMRIRSEALTVLTDEEIIKTDRPVAMELGGAIVHGTGMVANNATQRVHLASKGEIIYPPHANR
jgi:lipopolysaccharide export system protein LptC